MLKALSMSGQLGQQFGAIALLNRADESVMLVYDVPLLRTEDALLIGFVRVDEVRKAAGEIVQASGKIDQVGVFSRIRDSAVKRGVMLRYIEKPVALDRALVVGLNRAQVRHKARMRQAAEITEASFRHDIRIEKLRRIREVEWTDEETAVCARFDKAFRNQTIECLACGRTADPKAIPQDRFVELHSGG